MQKKYLSPKVKFKTIVVGNMLAGSGNQGGGSGGSGTPGAKQAMSTDFDDAPSEDSNTSTWGNAW